MKYYFLLFVSVAFAVANNLLFHKMGEPKKKNCKKAADFAKSAYKNDEQAVGNDGDKYNSFAFTALQAAVWFVILVPNIIFSGVNGTEFVFGSIFGIAQVLFLWFKLKAMSTGPVSITSVMSNMSMLFSTILGIILFNETPSALQIFGGFSIVVSVLLCTLKKSDDEAVKAQKCWKYMCFGYFVFAAVLGSIQKIFAKFQGESGKLLAVASVWMFVLSTLFAVASSLKSLPSFQYSQDFSQITRSSKPKFFVRLNEIVKSWGITRNHALFAVACGICTVGYNKLNLVLAAKLPSVVFFPVFNGSIVLLCAVLGCVIFGEKLTKRQVFGVAVGIAAVICIGIG